jgi:hypothetical protein
MARYRKVICQKTGAYCRPEDLVRDGYTNLMVAKWNYDPPEPPAPRFNNRVQQRMPEYTESYYQDVITFPTLNGDTMMQYAPLRIRVQNGVISGYYTTPEGVLLTGVGEYGVGEYGVGGASGSITIVPL